MQGVQHIHALWRSEQGTSLVEYVAVSGIALIVTGIIIGAMTTKRRTIGAAMAHIHTHLIESFEGGHDGTINITVLLHHQPEIQP